MAVFPVLIRAEELRLDPRKAREQAYRMPQNADDAAVEMAPVQWWADAESSTISAPITQLKRGNTLTADEIPYGTVGGNARENRGSPSQNPLGNSYGEPS